MPIENFDHKEYAEPVDTFIKNNTDVRYRKSEESRMLFESEDEIEMFHRQLNIGFT